MSIPTRALRNSFIPAARNLPRVPSNTSPFSFRHRTMATSAKEFLCILPDKPDALARRLEVRPTHLADAQAHVGNGKMAVGGAMFAEHPTEGKTPSFKGSVFIYTVKDAEEAWELIRNDIYAKSDVWDLEKAQVIPFKSAVRESL
ncbi:YCII-related domain protein [Colletotrichum tofieldiae]|uniref:YCII-related domain protein n=1 Tax=Colletotrichum tofieldiae TaxID=708197 RepID=A0A161VYH4_9PEZI|nr:YCII-related domain protein [Colletotrichum tofieldiae]GKT55930.1 YCII-related domain protein [Colletotrichum tofieldiae]GKT79234.1 YCII-related domain protein [Colletotrichum tofieldiae]GKT82402.1 YCII-related domain protein [Colletotrichum tofieldiae]